MPRMLNGRDASLEEVLRFADLFSVPSYQRPYAWTAEKQVAELYTELYDTWQSAVQTGDEKWCFLGSAVFVKENEQARNVEVVDGQQRLTTLCILLSALRAKHPQSAGVVTPLIGQVVCPRVRLRSQDRVFFANMIIGGQIFGNAEGGANSQNQAQRNIVENAMWLKRQIDEDFAGEPTAVADFLSFILSHCLMIVVCADDPAVALRMFQTLNATGLDLRNSDLLKSWMLNGHIYDAENIRNQYAASWEQLENAIVELKGNANEFDEMLGHVRFIYMRAKQHVTLYEEMRDVLSRGDVVSPFDENNPCPIFDRILRPFGDAYCSIARESYPQAVGDDVEIVRSICKTLKWLNLLSFSDWRSVVMLLLKRHVPARSADTFLQKYERLMAYYLVTGRKLNTRISRYLRLIDEISRWTPAAGEFVSVAVELTVPEKNEFTDALNSDVYENIKGPRLKYLISRVNSFVSAMGNGIPFEDLSVEHVLPQTPIDDRGEHDANRQWSAWWDEDSRRQWTHKLGNLIPLPQARNSEVQNYSFDRKKALYAAGRNDHAAVASELLVRVFRAQTWGPEDVRHNHEFLVSRCIDRWGLAVTPGEEQRERLAREAPNRGHHAGGATANGVGHDRRRRDTTKYYLDGDRQCRLNHQELVDAVIRKYVHRPDVHCYEDVVMAFPDRIQGTKGVVVKIDDPRYLASLEEAAREPGRRRYAAETLELGGVRFGICKMWGRDYGRGNIPAFITRARELGFDIEEIPQA